MKNLLDKLVKSRDAAIVIRERLRPAAGKGTVIFPPTFANKTYNINQLHDGTNRVDIDTVGSQSNRMEDEFTKTPYSSLVPQIWVKVKLKDGSEKMINLLHAPHRLADASIRFSDGLYEQAHAAFTEYLRNHTVGKILRLSPMSLVFGVWDSRDTEIKIPRILSSTIFGMDAVELKRSAQYVPAVERREISDDDDAKEDAWSEIGLGHAPATNTHGGVVIKGDIFRESVINLISLRNLHADTEQETEDLQKYILALALISATLPGPYNLRQGCLLVRDGSDAYEINLVGPSGEEYGISVKHDELIPIARELAEKLGIVNVEHPVYEFNTKKAIEEAKKTKKKKGKK